MGGQQDNSLLPFDEEWFDVANQCGKEFELPNASSPFNPRWSDNSNSLVFLQDQHLQSPDILGKSYELEKISPSCTENRSCPNMQMVTSIANSVPTVNSQEGSSKDEDINHGPKTLNPLQNVSHTTGITSNVPIPVENQVGTSIHAPQSNCYSSVKNKAFSPSSLKSGRCNVKYTCKVCKREFANYNAYGGHMSFHAKMKKAAEKMLRR